jgi:hypothetical protein
MSDLTAKLSHQQLMLMQAMSGPFMKTGQWPVWQHVAIELDRQDLDAAALLKSLPSVGTRSVGRQSYGLAWYENQVLNDDSRPALTMAAGLHLTELEDVFGAWILQLIGYLIKRQLSAPSSPDSVRRNFVEADDVAREFPTMSTEYLRVVPYLLQHEPLLSRGVQGYYRKPDNSESWRYELNRNLLRFRGITKLTQYVDRQVELVEEAEREDDQLFASIAASTYNVSFDETVSQVVSEPAAEVPPTITPVIAPPLYVDATIRAELEAKRGKTALNLDKLLQLLTELDESYAANNPYACHALLRAVVDHVPPILSFQTFEQAASNYKWTQTDKKYMQRLLDFKAQADDVMHRRISKRPDVITMHDVPPRAYLNALLAECIHKL